MEQFIKMDTNVSTKNPCGTEQLEKLNCFYFFPLESKFGNDYEVECRMKLIYSREQKHILFTENSIWS